MESYGRAAIARCMECATMTDDENPQGGKASWWAVLKCRLFGYHAPSGGDRFACCGLSVYGVDRGGLLRKVGFWRSPNSPTSSNSTARPKVKFGRAADDSQ